LAECNFGSDEFLGFWDVYSTPTSSAFESEYFERNPQKALILLQHMFYQCKKYNRAKAYLEQGYKVNFLIW